MWWIRWIPRGKICILQSHILKYGGKIKINLGKIQKSFNWKMKLDEEIQAYVGPYTIYKYPGYNSIDKRHLQEKASM